MTLDEYLAPHGAAAEMARKLGITPAHLSRIRRGHKVPQPLLAIQIEQATGRRVLRSDLRPDWRTIWPEHRPRSGN